jgi:hypothetical protein
VAGEPAVRQQAGLAVTAAPADWFAALTSGCPVFVPHQVG